MSQSADLENKAVTIDLIGSHHSLHAVRKQQHYPVLSDPLGLTRADELVDDALSCVMKVSKLGLPQDQRVWTGHRKPQLKTCYRSEVCYLLRA